MQLRRLSFKEILYWIRTASEELLKFVLSTQFHEQDFPESVSFKIRFCARFQINCWIFARILRNINCVTIISSKHKLLFLSTLCSHCKLFGLLFMFLGLETLNFVWKCFNRDNIVQNVRNEKGNCENRIAINYFSHW